MRHLIYLLFVSTTCLHLSAQSTKYAVRNIPVELLKNANVVKRVDEKVLNIISSGKAIVKEHFVFTILNEKADNYATYKTFYNKFTSIESLNGRLYDALGNEIKHLKKKDIQDFSYDDNMSLANDVRYKKINFYNKTYPYTVEFEEEDVLTGLLDFPDWIPLSSTSMSVVASKYIITAPKTYTLRFKNFNQVQPPIIISNADKQQYTWETKLLKAITYEPFMPPIRDLVPSVMLAPSDFEADGYKGNMSTWEGYGKFIYQLQEGRDGLPEALKKQVHALTDNLKTDKEKVYALYNFLQKNTRYVSIQLGIGGWQPFSATEVGTKKYGDCKALSNYMISLLKETGIEGKYVTINAGSEEDAIYNDFPSFQFNHVISCVPLRGDTIWLECTSQTKSPGYMGGFTGNRTALLIDKKGGQLIQTPTYNFSDNLQQRNIKTMVDTEGNATLQAVTAYKALQQDEWHEYINQYSNNQLKELLKNKFALAQYDIIRYHFNESMQGPLPVVTETIEMVAPHYAQVSGKRLFIAPNMLTKENERLNTDSTRQFPVHINNEYTAIDTIEIKIPAGYTPESIPLPVTLACKFGKYRNTIKVEEEKIICHRYIENYSGLFPASDYEALASFRNQVYKADRVNIILIKK
jgi:hypothetical protein